MLCAEQGVTNKQKMLQQRINRLEQELLEAKRARDVLTGEYRVTLNQVIELGKADDKSSSLSQTVASLSEEVLQLRKQLENSKTTASDFEAKLLSVQCQLDLASAEKDHAVRRMQDAEASLQMQAKTLNGKGLLVFVCYSISVCDLHFFRFKRVWCLRTATTVDLLF